MEDASGEQYQFEQLGDRHQRLDFHCGVEPLDRYLHERATQDRRRGLAVPYVLAERKTGVIVGYYTLSNLSIASEQLPAKIARDTGRYRDVPAVLIGRLATAAKYRGQGFGKKLLVDALGRSLALSAHVGAMAVVVDAKDDNARAFYEHFGFLRFQEQAYRLFITMQTIRRTGISPVPTSTS